MTEFPKKYDPKEIEPRIQQFWEEEKIFKFDPESTKPTYSIDTPPPTLSGYIHMGHVLSYSQAEFVARYQRMIGKNVFYPMGFDDNGLPTERFVEKKYKVNITEDRPRGICQALPERDGDRRRQLPERVDDARNLRRLEPVIFDHQQALPDAYPSAHLSTFTTWAAWSGATSRPSGAPYARHRWPRLTSRIPSPCTRS